eukprot:scaffold7415_cov267-Pinguiococcus_pyrenoidosus.AAC.2
MLQVLEGEESGNPQTDADRPEVATTSRLTRLKRLKRLNRARESGAARHPRVSMVQSAFWAAFLLVATLVSHDVDAFSTAVQCARGLLAPPKIFDA